MSQIAAKRSPFQSSVFGLASFTIGTEGSNAINVAVRLKSARGQNIAQRVNAKVYLSDVATGVGLTATVPTSTVAIGTNGTILRANVTDKMFDILTDASGRFDLTIPQTAAPVTYYMVVVMPDGSISVSGAITFA
jgi:hypothetical protein